MLIIPGTWVCYPGMWTSFVKIYTQDPGIVTRKHGVISQVSGSISQECELHLLYWVEKDIEVQSFIFFSLKKQNKESYLSGGSRILHKFSVLLCLVETFSWTETVLLFQYGIF